MDKIPIHVEALGSHGESVVLIKSRDIHEALHICADRIIRAYSETDRGDGFPEREYKKREQDWVGYPWPSIVIMARAQEPKAKWFDLEELTTCDFWKEISD